ncbi:MAG: SPFH domain-containing protein [Planctomycetota bacterium]
MMNGGKLIVWALVAAAAVALGLLAWKWEIERIEVPPGKFLVVIHRWGKNLPPDEILAPDESYKGVLEETRGPGRHFLNPLFFGHEVREMTNIPTGKCGVLTRKFGTPIPQERIDAGELLAGDAEKGIVAEPLTPGTYSINPHAYDHEVVNAIEVKAQYVGVRTRKVGKDPGTLPRDKRQGSYVVAEEGFRGVQQAYLPPGTYYVNPFVEAITPIEVRSHKVDFDDISFPSRDGFTLRPRIQVEYAVIKDEAAELLVRITDEGNIYQADQSREDIARNEILQKVVLPHIRGFARLEGSNFNATDFILVPGETSDTVINARERFRQALLEAVKPRCEELGVDIRAISVGQMEPPPELASEISDRETALAEQLRNKEMVKQYTNEQALKAQEAQALQKRERVQAETRLAQAETQAKTRLEVEKQKLTALVTVAESQLEAAKEQAKAVRSKAEAEAAVITAQNEAEVAALRTSVAGFGSPELFARNAVLARVAPSLGEIFAADDSDFGRLFTALLLPPAVPAETPPEPLTSTPPRIMPATAVEPPPAVPTPSPAP